MFVCLFFFKLKIIFIIYIQNNSIVKAEVFRVFGFVFFFAPILVFVYLTLLCCTMLFVLTFKKTGKGLRLNKYLEVEKVINVSSFVRKEVLIS